MIRTERTLEFDPVTKTHEKFHFDVHDGSFIIETRQDVEDIIEVNKASFAAHDEHTRHKEWSRVASIPMNIYMQLQKQGILDDDKAFRRWLNDPENRYFRTRPGRV